jgi:hypothetical protein
MTTLFAHFDGHVLIPEGPVDLPKGQTLRLEVQVASPTTLPVAPPPEQEFDIHPVTGFAMFRVPPDSPPIHLEDVLRAEEEDEL